MSVLVRKLGFTKQSAFIVHDGANHGDGVQPLTRSKGCGPGRPLAFAIGTISLTIVALSFVSFGRRVAHAGSVYGYISAACGRRLGFIAGWTLLLTYLSYASGCTALIGNFVETAAQNCGVQNSKLWLVAGISGLLLASVFAFLDMRITGRLMLPLEAVSARNSRRSKSPSRSSSPEVPGRTSGLVGRSSVHQWKLTRVLQQRWFTR